MELSDDQELPICDTLDLSGQGLKKLSRCPSNADISTLIADDNELQRLDNLDSYHRITKLSIVRNQLLRMYGVTKLHNLVTLNLANNGILTIEGIKDMPNLTTLCLAGNNVKSIEHLHTNTKLDHLDLSENSISHISDISYLRNLKELFLHNNRIITLRQGEKYLPVSLETLTLSNNKITDLNEMSHLGGLTNLVNFSIANNPCVSLSGNSTGFDYRPFVINWCMSLKSIDGYAVDPIESLKAEWLYSQGRGRQFRVGEHLLLAQYLASVCPLSGESLENETDRKLRLILSKAQHHQKQLSQQSDSGMSSSPATRRRLGSDRTNSPRRPSLNRNSMKVRSPDRMVASCHTETMASSCHSALGDTHDGLMTQSLDPNMLSCNFNVKGKDSSLQDVEETSSPLQAATKLVPVPESLMSPDFRPPSGLCRIPPKTPPSRIKSPVQIIQASKIPTEITKSIPSNQIQKTPVSSLKSSSTLMKSNSATNCTTKITIAKPILTNINGKCPQSVKLNNYVQSKTMTPKRNAKNSPNMSRIVSQKSRIPTDQQHLKNQRFNGAKSSKNDDNNIAISSDEDSEVCHSKLDVIRHRANQRRQEDTNKSEDKTEKAAICIQKIWRGYHTRNLNKKVTNTLKTIEMIRTNKYIQKLSTDMEATRTALESEHKLQLLQMQAINALWKKVVSLQPSNDNNNKDNNNTNNSSQQQQNNDVVINLAQTCNLLHTQVQQLQDSMSEIKRCMTNMQPKNIIQIDQGVGTQTEISAVHTPAGEENTFPYAKQLNRPQSLSIQSTIHELNEDKNQFNDFGFKKVSQSTDTTDDEINTDILNSSSNPEIADTIDEELFKHCDDDESNNIHDIANCSNDNYVVKENIAVSEETLCKELHNLIKTETGDGGGGQSEEQSKNEKDDSDEIEWKKSFVE